MELHITKVGKKRKLRNNNKDHVCIGTKYSRMDQVKFVDISLKQIISLHIF